MKRIKSTWKKIETGTWSLSLSGNVRHYFISNKETACGETYQLGNPKLMGGELCGKCRKAILRGGRWVRAKNQRNTQGEYYANYSNH
jgi:hypothetical protein